MKLTPEEMEFLYPITSVIVHRNAHITVKRSSRFKPQPPKKTHGQIIQVLSQKSRKRLNHIMQCTHVKFYSMVTLTYGRFYPRDGKAVKKDLNYILKTLRSWSSDYLWFLEFQKRGAPHFHVFLTTRSITPNMRQRLMTKWVTRQTKQEYFWLYCPVGDNVNEITKLVLFNAHERVWELFRHPQGAKRYAAKYAIKTNQKKVPADYQDVGRFWGCSRNVSNIEGVEVDTDETRLREIINKMGHSAKDYPIVPRYLWGVETGKLEQQKNGNGLTKT